MDPADFYTGLVAELYAPLRAHVPDPEPYAELLRARGGPALELGCGDGDPLLELRRRGLEVEGVDSSADMLERCRLAAGREGLSVVLHHQRMEDLALESRYRTIFLAGPTFTLLPDDDTARRALAAIRHHLTPDGVAVVPLWVPPRPDPAEVGRVKEVVDEDGATLRCTVIAQRRDERRRTQTTQLRYEMYCPQETATTQRDWLLHWYSPDGFATLAQQSGLRVQRAVRPDGSPAGPDADEFTVWLQPE